MIFLLLESYFEILFLYIGAYELLKELGFPQFWCAEFNSKIILDCS